MNQQEMDDYYEAMMKRWIRNQEVEFDADDMIAICRLALRWKKK